MTKKRVIGTSISNIYAAETELGRKLPQSFSDWLILNNGVSLGAVTIFPVFDARDPRKTWDSIVRNFKGRWQEWLENFSDLALDFSQLMPFAEFGTGDYYCFDYSTEGDIGEPVVIVWLHETGEVKQVADCFAQFSTSSDRFG